MDFFDDVGDFFGNILDKLRGENEDRRREDRALDFETEAQDITENPRIKSVNLRAKENGSRHNCEKYELLTRGKGESIIRRGGSLLFDIELNQEVDVKRSHQIKIFMNFGPRPMVAQNTKAVLVINGKKSFEKSDEEWDHRVVETDGNNAVLEIQIPPNTPVGAWGMAIEVKAKSDTEGKNRHLKRVDSPVYILFNPWNKDDSVYMKNEDERQEYVLNDIGKIFSGGLPGRDWVYGQFDDAVLPACTILMEKSGLLPDQRDDPVAVSRAISKMVNSNDDNGVLVGRWEKTYPNGKSPSAWSGSIEILEQYLRSGEPVRYGQCWVFSGVVTTVCRALGLPCRTVSNVNSAHDTNMSLTIDRYFLDADGNRYNPTDPRAGGVGDSIWNFHVWNDVWMERPDLPAGYGGWQAIDATPQNTSGGVNQCGPASLESIRTGQIHHKYDVDFVMAEVNADLVRWIKDETDESGFKKIGTERSYVGRALWTKCVEDDLKQCTREYKEREGSKAERVALEHAARGTRNARAAFRFPSKVFDDVEFKLEDIDVIKIGDDFVIKVQIKNVSDKVRSVSLIVTASSEYYTGVNAGQINKANGSFVLDGGEKRDLSLTCNYKQYYDKLVEYANVRVVAIANVKETSQTWIAEDSFKIEKPMIDIKIEEPVQIGKAVEIEFSFKNPLDIMLEKCSLVIDGPGLTRPKTVPMSPVAPNGMMNYKFKIRAKTTGRRTLVANFNSTQMVDLTGSKRIDVIE